jgi:hypothetical protein
VDPQTTVQEQLDSALDWMNLADHFATALAFENQALAKKMDELRQRLRHVEGISVNAIKMEEELLEARALVTTYEVMEDNTQELERQNRNLKRCLTELAGEFDTYRACTIFAIARARQYEAEFKAIQEEWVVNHRLRALLLTSWPVIDTLYDDKWPTDPSRGVAWKEIKDESNRWDMSEFNNVAPYGKKWPNPNEKCLDGTACVFCQNSFGPEGYYRLGTCACLYHPQCLIRGMVTIRRCQVCHATFHPRLYQMFGMQDFMPTHIYYSIYDFPNVALEEHTGQPVEWSWKYNKSKLELFREYPRNWHQNPDTLLWMADELYPNKLQKYGPKMFIYQSFGWYWVANGPGLNTRKLKKRRGPILYTVTGDISSSDNELEALVDDLPGIGTTEQEAWSNERYYRERYGIAAVDLLLHRPAPEVEAWLKGGPRPPRRRIPLSPESMAYRTRSNIRAIKRRRATTGLARAPRVLQWGEGGSGLDNAIEIDD